MNKTDNKIPRIGVFQPTKLVTEYRQALNLNLNPANFSALQRGICNVFAGSRLKGF
jgi:hypothetical protein